MWKAEVLPRKYCLLSVSPDRPFSTRLLASSGRSAFPARYLMGCACVVLFNSRTKLWKGKEFSISIYPSEAITACNARENCQGTSVQHVHVSLGERASPLT